MKFVFILSVFPIFYSKTEQGAEELKALKSILALTRKNIYWAFERVAFWLQYTIDVSVRKQNKFTHFHFSFTLIDQCLKMNIFQL